jgi:hypothetical protein
MMLGAAWIKWRTKWISPEPTSQTVGAADAPAATGASSAATATDSVLATHTVSSCGAPAASASSVAPSAESLAVSLPFAVPVVATLWIPTSMRECLVHTDAYDDGARHFKFSVHPSSNFRDSNRAARVGDTAEVDVSLEVYSLGAKCYAHRKCYTDEVCPRSVKVFAVEKTSAEVDAFSDALFKKLDAQRDAFATQGEMRWMRNGDYCMMGARWRADCWRWRLASPQHPKQPSMWRVFNWCNKWDGFTLAMRDSLDEFGITPEAWAQAEIEANVKAMAKVAAKDHAHFAVFANEYVSTLHRLLQLSPHQSWLHDATSAVISASIAYARLQHTSQPAPDLRGGMLLEVLHRAAFGTCMRRTEFGARLENGTAYVMDRLSPEERTLVVTELKTRPPSHASDLCDIMLAQTVVRQRDFTAFRRSRMDAFLEVRVPRDSNYDPANIVGQFLSRFAKPNTEVLTRAVITAAAKAATAAAAAKAAGRPKKKRMTTRAQEQGLIKRTAGYSITARERTPFAAVIERFRISINQQDSANSILLYEYNINGKRYRPAYDLTTDEVARQSRSSDE